MARYEPLPLKQVHIPFDDPTWIFELKLDGFRAIARVEDGRAELISRRGNVYKSLHLAPLQHEIPAALRVSSAVLDGELVVLDSNGRPQFSELMRRCGTPIFVAFDLLELQGQDVRDLPLLRRKTLLRRAVRAGSKVVQLLDHVLGEGQKLFATACARDLEGIVAKRADSPYRTVGHPGWLEIKNPNCSQGEGRGELFER